jgi:hypothetical protein
MLGDEALTDGQKGLNGVIRRGGDRP